MPDADRPEAWFRFARQDLKVADLAMRQPESLYGAACFHAQQAAEKALKGFLVSCRKPFPYSHDLVRLLKLVSAVRPSVLRLRRDATELTPSAWMSRYPGLGPSSTRADAVAALAAARRIVKAVMPPARPSKTGR